MCKQRYKAQLYLMISTGLVVPGTTTVLSNKYVLMVVQVPVLAILNSIDHSQLQVIECWQLTFISHRNCKHVCTATGYMNEWSGCWVIFIPPSHITSQNKLTRSVTYSAAMSSTSATVSGSGCKIKNTTYEQMAIQFLFGRKNYVLISLHRSYFNNYT